MRGLRVQSELNVEHLNIRIYLQEAYEILTKYEAEETKREVEEVYSLRDSFTMLQSKAVSIIMTLMPILFDVFFLNKCDLVCCKCDKL